MTAAPQVTWTGWPNEISFRMECHGGEVRAPPREHPKGMLSRSRRVILLVHGFNVDLCAAGASYREFTAPLYLHWKSRTVWVYWPGDAVARRPLLARLSGILSAASYLFQADRAEEAARKLADHIGRASSTFLPKEPIRLTIIAHSLGCRLALELINSLGPLAEGGTVKLELLVLMAAAVPLYLVRPRKRFSLFRSGIGTVLIYYSRCDKILQLAFRPGQFSASTDPRNRFFDRAALGRQGLGSVIPANVEQIQVSNGHSEYWSDQSIRERVMLELSGMVRPVRGRSLPSRSLSSGRVLEPRRLKLRSIQSRIRNQGIRQDCNCTAG
jgi:Alpha/beta hydrolase of unknown function (DUF900)